MEACWFKQMLNHFPTSMLAEAIVNSMSVTLTVLAHVAIRSPIFGSLNVRPCSPSWSRLRIDSSSFSTARWSVDTHGTSTSALFGFPSLPPLRFSDNLSLDLFITMLTSYLWMTIVPCCLGHRFAMVRNAIGIDLFIDIISPYWSAVTENDLQCTTTLERVRELSNGPW